MRMIKVLILVIATIFELSIYAQNADGQLQKPKESYVYLAKPKVLVFSKIGAWRNPAHTVTGYFHKSISAGREMLTKMAADHNFEVVFTDSSTLFTDQGLAPFDAIIFLNPNGYILNENEREAFQKYMRSGKGYVGIHAAANCELDWPWYMKLTCAYETGVNANNVEGTVVLQNETHASVKNLPKTFSVKDEWLKYNLDVRSLNDSNIKLLAVVNEDCYKPGVTSTHSISWYHQYDGGRVWYTGFGHQAPVFSDPNVIENIWGGIQYAVDKPLTEVKNQ